MQNGRCSTHTWVIFRAAASDLGIPLAVWLVALFILAWHWQLEPFGGMLSKEHTFTFLSIAANVPEVFDCSTRLLNSLNIPLSVETVCVFTAPIFSANASWATYLLTKVAFSPKHEFSQYLFSSGNSVLLTSTLSIGSKGHWSWIDGSSHFGNSNCTSDLSPCHFWPWKIILVWRFFYLICRC